MKKYINFIVTAIIFLTVIIPLNGQLSNRIHEQLRFSYITIDEGLNNNRVRGLGQDNYGFIWIGTRKGVARFDGYNIKQYFKYFIEDTAGVLESFDFPETRGIFCDSYHTLWTVGTYGICYFDWAQDKFIKFQNEEIDVDITSCGGMDEDADRTLWFATNRGLLKYNPGKDEIYLYLQEDNNPKAPPRGSLDKIAATQKNHIWFTLIRNGAGYLDQSSGVFTHYRPTAEENSMAEARTERIYEDRQGNIWIGHNNNGTSKYRYATNDFKRYYPEPGRKESGRVRGIIEDGQGNFWFGTQGGLYLFDRRNETFKRYAYADHPISTLSHNSIQTMMVDNQEGLWLGTFAGGVSYTNLNSSGIVKYEYNKIPSVYYLNDKNVYSLAFDNDENIWVGTENGGLNFLDRKTGKFTYFMEGNGDETATRSNNIKDIAVDENNLVWFGTYKGGMSYYNPFTGKFRHFQSRPDFPNGLSDVTVFVVYPDKLDKNLTWIGGTSSLYAFDEEEETFTQITPETPGYNNTPNISRVYRIVTTKDKKMIIGTNMLLILDRTTNTFSYEESFNNINIGQIDFVFIDKYDYIWACVNTTFLVRYNLNDRSYITIGEKEGLQPIDYYEGIDDDEGNIWLSSDHGVWKLENIIETPDSFKIVHYDKSDNVQSLEFLYHSRAKSPSGEILFGGINGFNSFNPSKVKPNPFVPNVIVTKLAITGEEVEVGEKVFGKIILEKPVMETKNLHFHHKIKVFSFHFTGFHFVAPENNQFKYILDGYDDDWQYTDANVRVATYSNIPRGKYVFKVDATNNNGKWSNKPFTINVRITPPFWKTLWFYSIIALVIAFLVYLFIQWREQQLRRDKEVLEEKLKKGQEEIENSKIELSKQTDELRRRDIAEREQRWHNNGMIKIGDIITKYKNDLNELAKNFLSGLIDYLEAQQGVIFVLNEEEENKHLEFLAGYGLTKNKIKQKKLEIGEGLVGVCYKDMETMIIDEVPNGYTEIGSGVGSTNPCCLILIPLKVDEIIIGVLELASIHAAEEYKIKFVEKICEMFSSNLFTSQTSKKMTLLLQKSQQQAEEMLAQEEEMRQNMEEMLATQEEAARREQELMDLNKQMEKDKKGFQKSIREKEQALSKAHNIIARLEKEIEKIKKDTKNKSQSDTESKTKTKENRK